MQKEEGRMMRFKHPSKWEEEVRARQRRGAASRGGHARGPAAAFSSGAAPRGARRRARARRSLLPSSRQRWRQQFWADARANCDAAIKEFVECSKEHGMLVVIKCRSSNKAMNQCLSKYTTEELWEPFKAARVQERDALIASGAVVGMAGPVKEGEGK